MAKLQEEFLKGSLIITVETKSRICLDTVQHNHKNVERQDFKILGKGYRNNAMKQKISEALYCRELKPTLNVQEKSIDLKLFN